jgi:periplasmic protein CpxP/Spy
MHKHWFIALALCAFGFSMSAGAIAQDNANSNQQPAQGEQSGPMHGRGHMDPEKRTEHLTKELKLNSDQQAKVLEIFKSEQSQMQSLWSDSSASQDDRRSKMMDIRKQSSDQVRALLDADQQKKFDAMQMRQEEHHHQGGQNPGATPN